VLPSGASLTTGTTNYLTNVLTVGEWQVLENAGAIFLSASGYRNGVTATNATIIADTYTGNVSPTVGDANQSNNPVGSYWSTTYSGSNAYRFYFGNTTVTPAQTGGVRYYGYAVRLVRDIT
jgi:hypothetical protein